MALKTFVKCNRCGLVFPADYFDNWGRKYGKGLGSNPVCEGLDSKYHRPFAAPEGRPEMAMYPVGVCRGTMITVELDENTKTATLKDNDRNYAKRAPLMRIIQRAKMPALEAHLKAIESTWPTI